MIFTTSWDDGTYLDLKILDLLEKYNLKGTFYISRFPGKEYNALTENEIREIAVTNEIGSHTINHCDLSLLSLEQQKAELIDSKNWIEQIVSKSCSSFCPPFGKYNEDTIEIAKSSGYMLFRTTNILSNGQSTDFIINPSFNVYPYPFRKNFTRIKYLLDPLLPIRINYQKLYRFNVPLKRLASWIEIAKYLFSYYLKNGYPIFHLFGHGHELEQYKMWNQLKQFFEYVTTFKRISYLTNSELIKIRENE